jgi:hypothetical protein
VRNCAWVPFSFENIEPLDFDCTSDRTDDYNCIAWAFGKTDVPWWPTTISPYYWPPELPKEPQEVAETIENFVAAFTGEGYRVCKSGKMESGYEKIAIYADDKHIPTHAARMLPDGIWSSKLGDFEDIEHKTLHGIEGQEYGHVVRFMRRRIPCQETNLLRRSRSFLSRIFGRQLRAFSLIQSGNPTSS